MGLKRLSGGMHWSAPPAQRCCHQCQPLSGGLEFTAASCLRTPTVPRAASSPDSGGGGGSGEGGDGGDDYVVELPWLTWIAFMLVLFVAKVANSGCFISNAIFINNSVKPEKRAAQNGFSMTDSVCCFPNSIAYVVRRVVWVVHRATQSVAI